MQRKKAVNHPFE